ncbi:transposase [Sabulicella rubraurantiaca]|uniref:transposase n=1 Tax=Sabulicella rubraurantiaca TaxID=2811429 RepID=UPI001A95E91D
MSKPIERVEIITRRERRRRYSAEEEVRLVEETTRPGMTVSAVARLHGAPPSPLFGWLRPRSGRRAHDRGRSGGGPGGRGGGGRQLRP